LVIGWGSGGIGESAQLVIIFAATEILKEKEFIQETKGMYPVAHLLGCSTSGEIYGTRVFDDTLVATAIYFESTEIMGGQITLDNISSSTEAGAILASPLNMKDCVMFLFSPMVSI